MKKGEEIRLSEQEQEMMGTQEAVRPMNVVSAILKLLYSPTEVFKSLESKTHIVIPIILSVVVGLASVFLSQDIVQEYTREALMYMSSVQGVEYSPEMIEQQLDIIRIANLVFAPLAMAAIPLVKGLMVFGLVQLFGGRAKIAQNISAIALAYMIVVIGLVIRTPIVLASGTVITFSPAMLLSSDQAFSPLASFLANFDLFSLWYLGVSIIGVKVVNKFSGVKAAVCVFIPYLLTLIPGIWSMLMMNVAK